MIHRLTSLFAASRHGVPAVTQRAGHASRGSGHAFRGSEERLLDGRRVEVGEPVKHLEDDECDGEEKTRGTVDLTDAGGENNRRE